MFRIAVLLYLRLLWPEDPPFLDCHHGFQFCIQNWLPKSCDNNVAASCSLITSLLGIYAPSIIHLRILTKANKNRFIFCLFLFFQPFTGISGHLITLIHVKIQIMFGILHFSDLKNGISNFSHNRNIHKIACIHDVGSSSGIESPNMHITPWEPLSTWVECSTALSCNWIEI